MNQLKVGFVFGAGGIFSCAIASGVERACRDAIGVDVHTAALSVGTSGGAAYLGYRSVMSIDEGDELLRGASQSPLDLNAFMSKKRLSQSHPLAGSPPEKLLGIYHLARAWRRREGDDKPLAVADRRLRQAPFICPIERLAHQDLPAEFPEKTWIVAYDLAARRRVVFGRDRAAALPDAVTASCCIPFLYRPHVIAETLYLDGGIESLTNLDLLASAGLDLVIVTNPTATWRSETFREMRYERALVKQSGARVVCIDVPASVQPCRYQDYMRTSRLGDAIDEIYPRALRQISAAVRAINADVLPDASMARDLVLPSLVLPSLVG